MAKRTQEQVMRRLLKRLNNQGKPCDVLPLMERERVHYDEDDYESYTEYGFLTNRYGFPLNGNNYTDDEINELFDEGVRMVINSPYDCTGMPFTRWIDWHRNPSGLISYRHRVGLDV